MIPKTYPIRKLCELLEPHGIILNRSLGKGGHGAFTGKDRDGNIQKFPLPSSMHKKEITGTYIRTLLRRFGLDEKIFE